MSQGLRTQSPERRSRWSLFDSSLFAQATNGALTGAAGVMQRRRNVSEKLFFSPLLRDLLPACDIYDDENMSGLRINTVAERLTFRVHWRIFRA